MAKKTRETAQTTKQNHTKPDKEKRLFPVIGIGASAGGLKPLQAFFSQVPKNSNMAFVVISHTDPDKTSMLPEILQRSSKIPVRQIEEKAKVLPDTVYLPAPDKDPVLENRVFHLQNRQKTDHLHMSIDRFFKSLAQDCGRQSGCIILSGAGADGTQGLREIKANHGVTMTQSLQTARHKSMPQSSQDTGMVDFTLPPKEMPGALISYFQHLGKIQPPDDFETKEPPVMPQILSLLTNRTKIDFSMYKQSTLVWRIERRMSLTGCRTGEEYINYLHRHPKEIDLLFEDLLIGVTNFFRDPEAFAFLKTNVVTELLEQQNKSEGLRIWVPGCSTGEEAYSVAMLIKEVMKEKGKDLQMQIFATDPNARAIAKARQGTYLENIATDVSADRLHRFFSKDQNTYHIKKEIRETVVFAVQDVLADPPFSNLDLVVCRNLLIYLQPVTQQKLIPLFHYVLKENRFLFLGTSERLDRHRDFFTPLSKKFSIFRKLPRKDGYTPRFHFPTGTGRLNKPAKIAIKNISEHPLNNVDMAQASENLLSNELYRIRQHYQAGMEELETSNDELRSANEELQSTNEELETSREELQSLNEELSTVNSELHTKIEELHEAYATITTVLNSTQIAILFLNNDLTIRRFTQKASSLINLIPSDVGRPIEHISHNLKYTHFSDKIRKVLDILEPFEDEVETINGRWYRMRIMVFQKEESTIDGAVITFIGTSRSDKKKET